MDENYKKVYDVLAEKEKDFEKCDKDVRNYIETTLDKKARQAQKARADANFILNY
jgi:hypothetical protein